MSPDWYQTHQLCNTSEDFCATLNCYRYGEEDMVQWNQFDYVNNANGQMENFMPNTDFSFGDLWQIILSEWWTRDKQPPEMENIEAEVLRQEIEQLKMIRKKEREDFLHMQQTYEIRLKNQVDKEQLQRILLSEDPIPVSHLQTAASLQLPAELIRKTDDEYLRRIISSGVTDDDIQILSQLVTSQHLPADFLQTLANCVTNDWSDDDPTPSLCEVLTAASLSKAGHITSVERMYLRNIDISGIPPDSLASLATRVSGGVCINNVTGDLTPIVENITSVSYMNLRNIDISGIPPDSLASLATRVSGTVIINNVTGDLTPIVGNIKCDRLYIPNQSLSKEVTQCLVTAMRDNIKKVVLGVDGDVIINNLELITQYDGRGRCGEVGCCGDTGRRYGQQLETWAHTVGWKVLMGDGTIIITRKLEGEFGP